MMIDGLQSCQILIQSPATLAQSVSTPLIITHDCCDLVPMLRQLELCLRTISYREMGLSEGNGKEGKSKKVIGQEA